MRVTPKSETQLRQEMLMPDGEYDFTVESAEEKDSSKGNPMIALVLKVYAADGKTRTMRDWLMTTSPGMEFKVRHFCEAVGMGAEYESGNLNAGDMKDRSGRVRVGNKTDADYGPQNTVKDYVVPEISETETGPKPVAAPRRGPAPASVRQSVGVGSPNTIDESDIPFSPQQNVHLW